jgi:hypothetical protein
LVVFALGVQRLAVEPVRRPVEVAGGAGRVFNLEGRATRLFSLSAIEEVERARVDGARLASARLSGVGARCSDKQPRKCGVRNKEFLFLIY